MLNFNEEERSIEIEPKEMWVEDGVRLRRPKSDEKTLLVAATKFLRKNNIGHPSTESFPAEWHPERKDRGCIVGPRFPIKVG